MIRTAGRSRQGRLGILMLVLAVTGSLAPVVATPVWGESPPDHLVISELVTGGASASDEFIELYNPTDAPLPLEGLELVYVTASGLTVSRRAAWEAGAPELPARQHLLVANELGAYAGIADALYAAGIAATGGTVAIRIQGATAAIDAVGWGAATSTWLEGVPAPAPASGSSLERLPGGALGSTQDTDDNAVDFVERPVPDPQNLGAAPTPDPSTPTPGPSASDGPPSPTATATPSPSATSTPTPTPAAVVSVATARALPDGATATIEGVALSDSTFTDGGGYVADASGGVAVLLSDGSFTRGARLRVTGTVDDRFAQRTLRASGAGVQILGAAAEPAPHAVATGMIGEDVEGRLVRIAGTITGAPASLSAGLAYWVDDGTGAARVVVGTATGIDSASWASGVHVDLVGVVGQRDSSGTGTSGYRVQPRDAGDVIAVGPTTPSPEPTPVPSAPSGEPGASPSPPAHGVVTIAEARALPRNAQATIRGTVTLPPGLVDPVSAAIQDTTGGILVRIGEEVGPLARGDVVQLVGVRSTLAGMDTLRVTRPATRLGQGDDPSAKSIRTGDAGEAVEAQLVRVRGAVVATARRSGSGSVSFEVDDGSGPLRVFLAAALGADTDGLVAGAWVEATGVLGQETTGSQALRGYRLWPRVGSEVRVTSAPTDAAGDASGTRDGSGIGGPATGGGATGESGSLAEIGAVDLASLRVNATVVHGPWPELEIAGLLWDGERLAAIAPSSERSVRDLLATVRVPVPVELGGLVADGTHDSGMPVVRLGNAPGDVIERAGAPHAPLGDLGREAPTWVAVVGRLTGSPDALRLQTAGAVVEVRLGCDEPGPVPPGSVRVTGIALPRPPRIVVPCDGLRAAPVLARAAGVVPDDGARTSSGDSAVAGAGTAGARETDTPMRPVAAALLVLSALLVAGAGVAVRHLAPRSMAGDGDPTGDADLEVAEAAEDRLDQPGPPALALVRVPQDRGSA